MRDDYKYTREDCQFNETCARGKRCSKAYTNQVAESYERKSLAPSFMAYLPNCYEQDDDFVDFSRGVKIKSSIGEIKIIPSESEVV